MGAILAGVTWYWTAIGNDFQMPTWSNVERLCVDLQSLEQHMGGRGEVNVATAGEARVYQSVIESGRGVMQCMES